MSRSHLAVAVLALTGILGVSPATAKQAPVKEILAAHVGWEVNRTKAKEGAPQAQRNVCSIQSKDECQPGSPSAQAGGFTFAQGVAGGPAPAGDVYVADTVNARVQEFTPAGHFLAMFGKKVDKNGADVCVQAEEGECQAGEESSAPGLFGSPHFVAVDPSSGDLYVYDQLFSGGLFAERVQKLTPSGEFVFEIGKGVNETTGGNLCTEQEVSKGVKCVDAVPHGAGGITPEPGSFYAVKAIAVGGPEDRLYVVDADGLQEFDAEGHPVSEPAKAITAKLLSDAAGHPLELTGLAVDGAGDVYLGNSTNLIRRYDPSGQETELTAGANVSVLASDPTGRLGAIEAQNGASLGTLYEVLPTGLHQLTSFTVAGVANGLAFNGLSFGEGNMFAIMTGATQELLAYEPRPVGELEALEAQCSEGPPRESNVTIDCSLVGNVDPWGVPQTAVWFEWGKTEALGEKTPPLSIAVKGPEGTEEPMTQVSSAITGLLPNESSNYYYQLAAEDRWVLPPEELTSPLPLAHFHTPAVLPRIVGEPRASFVTSSSAQLYGQVNPENSPTSYRFQYAPAKACEERERELGAQVTVAQCPGMSETESQESAGYGPAGTTLEASGLQPETAYRYRLYATNAQGGALDEHGEGNIRESTFSTRPGPVLQAITDGYSQLTSTSAVISGTVDPDGRSATYSFEVGIYKGAATEYGTVFVGPAGNGTVPMEKTLALTGLQPGTTYAYRIEIRSGSEAATGLAVTLQTPPVVTFAGSLSEPLLPFEAKPFPTAGGPRCARGHKRDRHGRCVKVAKGKRKGLRVRRHRHRKG